MTTPITVSVAHRLGRAEARRRIEAGFAKFVSHFPGGGICSERWEDDRLSFSVSTLGQTVSGVLDISDTAVRIEIHLPGLLGMFAGRLNDRLRKAGQLLLSKH
jgi:hypothetical protein